MTLTCSTSEATTKLVDLWNVPAYAGSDIGLFKPHPFVKLIKAEDVGDSQLLHHHIISAIH